MLYGFLGFHPTADGFSIDPKLPTDWPALTITHIAIHEHILDIKVSQDHTIAIDGGGPKDAALHINVPAGWKVAATAGLSVKVN